MPATTRWQGNVFSTARRPSALAVRLLGIVLVGGLPVPRETHAAAADAESRSILADMAAGQHRFRPEKLHNLGVDGLSAVLDELLPDTAAPKQLEVPPAEVEKLVGQLGSESFRARQTATEKLFQLGPAARPWLVPAARGADAEVSWRATRILRGWENQKWEDKSKYLPAFSIYAAGIRDDGRLRELLRRTLLALDAGMPDGGRLSTLDLCIRTIASSQKDEYTDRLTPLLRHADVEVAVLVTQSVGGALRPALGSRHFSYFPALLLEALRSDREEVVATAISYAETFGNTPRRAEIERLLLSIFAGPNEQLKFQACSPLIYSYRHQAAWDYLLQQLQSTDLNRRYMALSLCHCRQPGDAIDEKLLKALLPALKSADQHTRYMAAIALSSYAGEEVVKNLIPLLGDRYQIIPVELSRKLLEQRDRQMLRRLLSAAAKNDPKEPVRQQAASLLQRLEQPR